MGNLKHTIVAIIAVVMISSLAVVQTADLITAKADTVDTVVQQSANTKTTSESTNSVWNQEIIYNISTKILRNNELSTSVEANIENNTTNINQNLGYVIVNEGSLNVRSNASTDSEVVDQLSCADKVVILSEDGDFYQISYGKDNKIGYASKSSITTSYEDAKNVAIKTSMYEKGTAVVGDGALNIRSSASTDSQVVDQIDNGSTVVVIENQGEWLKIYYGRDYKIGYVISSLVNLDGVISKNEISKKMSDRVASSAMGKGIISISSGAVNVRESDNEKSDIKTQLEKNTNVLILSRNNSWTKIAYGSSNTVGYVKSEYIVDPTIKTSRSGDTRKTTNSKPTSNKKEVTTQAKSTPTSSSKGQAIVNEAEKYIGIKYVYGGSSTSGFDCSGLVQYVCAKQGISVGRSSRDQINDGVSVSRGDLQPGDLVFFKKNGVISHVGIYAGNGQMIHSPQTGETVTYTSINTIGRLTSYAGARRVAN